MKIYHMIVGVRSAEERGDTSTRKEFLSTHQGAAPIGHICVGVCGYHEEKKRTVNDEKGVYDYVEANYF